MKVLSLFNGMSVCSMALEGAGIEVDEMYISEIDKYANKASEVLFPNSIQLGSVLDWREWGIDWSSIDLVTGGFPCQAWSMAGKQLGDKDERGMLFWTMLDIMKQVRHYNQKADFLIENVRMKKEFEEYITTHTENALGEVHKTLINSALVSAQNRNRYYWTSFAVSQPSDKGIVLADVLECGMVDRDKSHCVDANYFKGGNLKSYFEKNRRQLVFDNVKCGAIRGRYLVDGKRGDSKVESIAGITEQRLELRKDDKTNALTTVQKDNVIVDLRPCEPREFDKNALCHHSATATDIKGNESIKRVYSETGKSPTLTTMGGGHREPKVSIDKSSYRKLTPRECMRLQTIPERYIDKLSDAGISNTQLYKMTGNAWTMKVISHILKCRINQT